MKTLHWCVTLILLGMSSMLRAQQAPPPLPTTEAILDRMEAVAAAENNVFVRTALKIVAAELRSGVKKKQVLRKKGMGKKTAARTTGENGKDDGPLERGWGAKQQLKIGIDFWERQAEIWCDNCVDNGFLTVADKNCLLKDGMTLALIHEWVHVQQTATIAQNDMAECFAYRIGCFFVDWFANEIAKYATPPGGAVHCSPPALLRGIGRKCRERLKKYCGG